MDKNKWDHRIATSTLHKALRVADEQMACFAAAYLSRYDFGAKAAWRRLMAFPAEDMRGAGAVIVARNYLAWESSRCEEVIPLTINHLCVIAAGGLDRSADELKNAAIAWNQGVRDPHPVIKGLWSGEVMPEMRYVGEFAAAATFLYQAMGQRDVEGAAQVAAWLFSIKSGERGKRAWMAAWRPLLHFAYQSSVRGGVEDMVSALHICHRHGYEGDNWYAGLLHVTDSPHKYEPASATLWRHATTLVESGEYPSVPEYALDVHTGDGTLEGWWAQVNALAPASRWREDAMKATFGPSPKGKPARATQAPLFSD